MNNDVKLIEALSAVANDYWRPDSPIYLSNIPRILDKTLSNFREILGERSLKNFAKATENQGRYEVVEHPTQSSRVVLAPAGKGFKFEPLDPTPVAPAAPVHARRPRTRAKTLDFLDCLALLPEHERSQVVIPVGVMVKLLEK
ncbi:hypothetical protein HH212_22785 [Massilia forsythiae]|uniref:Uncharacterized protein n=1 Tax=Massilia forsythiae TaxID=2728020 RepID=A0A7Z2W137_9BURK|nr:hypothetical protein [Massilia forsythiae]QJE02495.1 hypothetical protein HH212_22785 [Massilia forsythiae]